MKKLNIRKIRATVYQGDEYDRKPGWWYGQYKLDGAAKWTSILPRKTKESAKSALQNHLNKNFAKHPFDGIMVFWVEY